MFIFIRLRRTPDGQILKQAFVGQSEPDEYFYIHDRLGSIRLVLDEQGNVVNSYTYDPFGNLFTAETVENAENPFKFTGQWWDEEISQYYLRARQYDPQIMRFTGRDPVKGGFREPLTLHAYLYCLNDPVNMSDPSGKFAALAKPIVEGYAVHMAAIGFVAYGVNIGNQRFITLGIGMEQMIGPIIALGYLNTRATKLDKFLDGRDLQHGDNWFGNFNLPPGLPRAVVLAMGILYAAFEFKSCHDDWAPIPFEELPTSEDWNRLNERRWERAPDDKSDP